MKLPLCGGVLISSQHILTAAHCDESQAGFRLYSARMGTADIGVDADPLDPSTGIEVEIAAIKRHNKYARIPVAVFDIAVAKLRRPVLFSDTLTPICTVLPPPHSEPDSPAPGGYIVAGWGRTETSTSSELLQYTRLNQVPTHQCEEEYRQAGQGGRLGSGITGLDILQSQLCAQGVGRTDSCTGDSGGPLMQQIEGTWYLTGIVSFGTASCDSALPGVYTRVSEFYPWILKVMNNL